MRIGIVAAPWIPVPPPAYGGSEAVVDCLARGLADRGHDVLLFTVGTSTCPVPRAWVYRDAVEPMGHGIAEADHVLAAYRALAGCDVIHDHTVIGPVLAAGGADPRSAVVTTSHGPFTEELTRLYAARPDRVALVCISEHQRSTAGDLRVAAVIHHGIDLDVHRPGDLPPEDYLLFVGRMDAGKGPDRAIRIARAAGRPLVLVAKCREPAEHAYFEQVVRPLLGPDVTMYDELTPADRTALARRAAALLMPITWPEPFGLVMVEALACGTPVLAFPAGAAPEIVEPGVTGFLGDDEAALAAAVGRLGELDRATCRRRAEERFSMARMAEDHERLYTRLLAGVADGTLATGVAGTAAERLRREGLGEAERDPVVLPAGGAAEGVRVRARGDEPPVETAGAARGRVEVGAEVERRFARGGRF